MTATQKKIVISTLLFEALLLNAIFCNWEIGFSHRSQVNRWEGHFPDLSGMIMSFGPFGVYARNHTSIASDTILGIAVPIAFLAAALFIYTLGTKTSKPPIETEQPTKNQSI